ncbi:MAG: hypothetical protein ACT4PU_09740 [Planctomycetota bacterium]
MKVCNLLPKLAQIRLAVACYFAFAVAACSDAPTPETSADSASPASAPATSVESAATTEPVKAAAPAKKSGIEISMQGNTISSPELKTLGGWSAVDLVIVQPAAQPANLPTELRLRIKIAPSLADGVLEECSAELGRGGVRSFGINGQDGDQVLVKLELKRTDLTLTGRAIDVAGSRLRVSGVDLGALTSGDVVELSLDGVRVAGELRGPLPQ